MLRRCPLLVLGGLVVILAASGVSVIAQTPAAPKAAAPKTAQAPKAPVAAAKDLLPPIIDRDQFFGDPEIAGAQISPDGTFIAFMKPFKGTRNLWVKRTEEPFDKARPITADTKRPIPGYFWSRDAKYILFIQDQGGNENYNVYAVNPNDAPAAGADVPTARNITDAKNVRAQIFAVPKSDPDAIYVGLNDRDPAWHDLYKVKISTGQRTLVAKNTERMTGVVFDLKDQLRLVTRSTENGDTEILRADPDNKFSKIYTCTVFESCGPVRFHKDGQRVYMESNKGAVDLVRLVLLDVQTGKEELVEADPMNRVDLGSADFSQKTDELIATIYVDDKPRIYWKDKGFEADYTLLKSKLPGSEIGMGSSTADERLFIISASSDVDPGSTYLFDRQTKALTLQYKIREKLPRAALANMQTMRYKSSDGLEIPAYLTLPKGVPARNLPIIAFPHGGPWGRDNWGYSSFAQFLANRGYAVLQPNFRGSTGYGKKFLDAGNKQWGDKMQDDITWGVKHLVAQGIADPKRIGIMGGSYGGYATLAGVAFTPDVYAAAVSIVGPSNLITLLNSIPPYWEAGRKVFYERMGDPKTPEGKAQLERQSPLNSAAKIKTPLMVIQGANDPRVNKRESDQIVIALRDRGFPVEYIVAPDEGHGFARPVNNMATFAAAERFLSKFLGGRYQESMTPEVTARLKELTVDPKSVVLQKPVDATTVTTPKPAVPLTPGTFNYKATIAIGGQSMEMAVTTEIKEEGDNLVAADSAKTPMGDVSDRVTLDKKTLVLLKRSISQGPVTIDIAVKDGKATGELKMSGQTRPISVDIGGDLFGDGAGSYQVIATLPLAPGYKTSFRNLDVQTQKAQVVQLEVTGSESVTVPAGTFDAFKLELTVGDGGGKTTVWVAKESRKVPKFVGVRPQMQGATITTELQK
ncbi:MAG TPA: alpha/beta fold hydrolase [Vicinamibacterales bacterium]|jgi:dipeptidyl aminopeptidase/acylaminoacyl peptidase